MIFNILDHPDYGGIFGVITGLVNEKKILNHSCGCCNSLKLGKYCI
jgi:hypothetical protein